MICSNCKNKISKDDKFCGFCGSTFKKTKEGASNLKTTQLRSNTTVQDTTTFLDYAGFWIRTGAFIIDYSLILITAFILSFLIYEIGLTWPAESDTIVGTIFIIFYHTFFLSILPSTPGRMLYSLRVVDENTKENIKFGKALLRSLSYIPSCFIFGLGFWTIVFDKPKHQGWHDKIAKTLTIRKTKKSLTLPIILSVIALCFSLWNMYGGEEDYSFNYLGEEESILDLVQRRASQQSEGYCCSYASSWATGNYLEKIPLTLFSEEEKNAEQIFEDFSNGIVTVGGEISSGEFYFGSGFFISPSGLFVTNYHVIDGLSKLAVAFEEREIQVLDVNLIIDEDPDKDIAILKIEGENLPHVVMGNSDLVKTGEKVFAIGNPEGFVNTISEGIISQVRELEEGIKLFQITNPISPGSSGGALFNRQGKVIGITALTFEEGQNINFAIPINYVKRLLGLRIDSSDIGTKDSSDDLFCNGIYWSPCGTGEEFYCPLQGDPFCCVGIICHDECWGLCDYGYNFVCPLSGDAYCE